jgi:hypothetical protein
MTLVRYSLNALGWLCRYWPAWLALGGRHLILDNWIVGNSLVIKLTYIFHVAGACLLRTLDIALSDCDITTFRISDVLQNLPRVSCG